MSDAPLPIPQPNALTDAKGQTTQTGYRYYQSLDRSVRGILSTLPQEATAAQYLSNVPGVWLSPDGVWDAANIVALTDAATIAIDMSLGFNFSVSIAGNQTLGNPSNAKAGQSGCILITASGGARTIQVGSNWKKTVDLTFPAPIASGETAYLFYWVESSSRIIVTSVLNNPT